MFYCVLTGFAVLLISGKAWLSLSVMVVFFMGSLVLRGWTEGQVRRRGGIKSARLLECTSYNNSEGIVNPAHTEYTVLVKYRNGQKARYVLNGNQTFFKMLIPYIGNI